MSGYISYFISIVIHKAKPIMCVLGNAAIKNVPIDNKPVCLRCKRHHVYKKESSRTAQSDSNDCVPDDSSVWFYIGWLMRPLHVVAAQACYGGCLAPPADPRAAHQKLLRRCERLAAAAKVFSDPVAP